METIEQADGRQLAYAVWGDPAGFPVVVLHGTPGCRLNRYPDEQALAAAGIRVITYDRPGYGGSDRDPGRQVAGCVADVAAIADAVGVDRFAVSGGSGGGPHALAVAAGLPDRVTRAGCAVGFAPYGAPAWTGTRGWTRRTSRSSAGPWPARRSCTAADPGGGRDGSRGSPGTRPGRSATTGSWPRPTGRCWPTRWSSR